MVVVRERERRVSATAARKRALYAKRKAAGLCVRCGRDGEGLTLCGEHRARAQAQQRTYLDTRNASSRRVRAKRKVMGICRDCDAPTEEGRVHCATHAEAYNRGRTRSARQARLEVRAAIEERDGAGCFYDGSLLAVEIDHEEATRTHPGGDWTSREARKHGIDNLRLCCGFCNKQKSRRPAAEFIRQLMAEGRATERAVSRLREIEAFARE